MWRNMKETISNMCLLKFFHSELNFLFDLSVVFSYEFISGYRLYIVHYICKMYRTGELLRFLHRTILGTLACRILCNSEFLTSILFDAHPRYFENTRRQHADAGKRSRGETIRRRISHKTPDTHGGANSQDLRAWRKCALNVTQKCRRWDAPHFHGGDMLRHAMRTWRKVAPASRELITRDALLRSLTSEYAALTARFHVYSSRRIYLRDVYAFLERNSVCAFRINCFLLCVFILILKRAQMEMH